MNRLIGTLGITLIILLPLIRFYQRSNYTKKQNLITIFGLAVLWFFIATPLHELCHFLGAKIVGQEVFECRFLPEYWKGDFRNAFVQTYYNNVFNEFVIRTAPYFRDLIMAIIGFFILIKKPLRHSFLVGFIFLFFMLNSVYDIMVNFLGYSIDNDGDLNGLSKLIGETWTYVLGIGIIVITSLLTYRIFKVYKGFPVEEKETIQFVVQQKEIQ